LVEEPVGGIVGSNRPVKIEEDAITHRCGPGWQRAQGAMHPAGSPTPLRQELGKELGASCSCGVRPKDMSLLLEMPPIRDRDAPVTIPGASFSNTQVKPADA
jgi:hypothetical protein